MEAVPQGSFIGTFLDSPIISSDRDAILAVLRRAGEASDAIPDVALRKAMYLLKTIGTTNVVALDPEYYDWFIRSLEPIKRDHLLDSALDCEGSMIKVLKKSPWSWARLIQEGLATPPELPDQAKVWYSKTMQLTDIISEIAISRAKGARQLIDSRSGNLRYVGDQHYGCVELNSSGEWTLVTYTQLLMLKDLMYVRFNAYTASAHVYPGNTEMLDMLDKVINWQMKCLGYYGNAGYELLKSIEALAKCNLTRLHDRYLARDGSYQNMVEKVKEKERKMSGGPTPLVDELTCYLESITDTQVAVELFGTQKFSGHPLVDPVLAGKSVREEAAKKINYSPYNCQRLRNNCCRLYVEGYIKKNGRWPPLVFPRTSRRTRLYHLYTINELNIKKGSYDLDDWTGVRFAPHLTFEGFQNYLDLMDDKAVSFYREDCRATWDKKISPHSHKRLLVELLSRGEFKVMEIVERVRRGDIPASWLIVSLYPKERELKIAARLFAMMVLEMRVFFAACEANLAEYVYPCLEAQTMTLSKQEVKELFTSLTKEYNTQQLVRLYLEVDLSRWNLRWHPEVVDPVGEDLNDMFGMEGVFNTIHHFFKRCLILVRVNSAPPPGLSQDPIPESDLCFYNHEVGFEGIAQKLWSFLTFGMIDLAMVEHEGPYYLVGQGDNQVLLMTVSVEGVLDPESYIKSVTTQLTARIEEECAKVGQEAKPEECIQSTSVVTYSKNVYIRGVEYHTVIKGCSRIFPNASSDFPSINGSIGAISASCTSAAELMDNPLDAYRLMIFHLALYLFSLREVTWVESCYLSKGIKESLTRDLVMSLLILPNDLGGMLIAPITSFIYKGGADSLSKSLASLKFYQAGSKVARRIIHALKTGKWMDPHQGIEALLEDPYSLPIRRPKGAEHSVKMESIDCIRSLTKNRALSDIMSSQTEKFEEDLMSVLMKVTPFNPVLLSDVLSFSVLGVKSNLQNMFTSTRTVQSLLHTSGAFEFNICVRILMSGIIYFQDTLRRLSSLSANEDTIRSIYDDVTLLRSYWRREGALINMVGVTSYMPFEFDISISTSYQELNGFHTLFRCQSFREGMTKRGEWPHYDGLDTQEKRSEYGYKIVTSTSAASAISRLAKIATQPGVDQSFIDLISAVALTRADIDLRNLLPLLSRAIGGSIAHRYVAISGSRGAYGLNTTTWSTHCVPYTDTVEPISASVLDYPIMVQEMMVAGIACARLAVQAGTTGGVITLVVIPDSVRPLPDDPVKVEITKPISPPMFKDNNLVYDNDIRLRKITGGFECALVESLDQSITAEELMLESVRASIRQSYLARNTALRVLDAKSRFIGFRLDVLEVLGIGVKRLCNLMALEIASLAGNQTMIASREGVRWTPVPAIVSLATAAAASLMPLLSHPLVREDPFIAEDVPLSLFKYSFIGAGLEKKVRSYITSSALRLLLSPGSKVYKAPEVLFADDNANNTIYLLARRVRLTILQSVLIGELNPSVVSTLVKVVVTGPLGGRSSDDDKVDRLSRALSSLLHWAESENLLALSAHVRHLVQGKFLLSHRRSAKEVIRIARTLSPLRLVRAPVKRVLMTEKDISELIASTKLPQSSIISAKDEWSAPFKGIGVGDEVFKSNYWHFHIERLRGRVYGCDSNAGYSYACVGDYFSNRVVMIIGCGYGSGAAVALLLGAAQVIGLDIRDDLVEIELLRRNVIPPAVARLGLGDRFVRVRVDEDYNGDFYSPLTPSILREYTGSGTLSVIDVPVRTPKEAISVIRQLQLSFSAGTLLWRIRTNVISFESVIATLAVSGVLGEVRVIHSSHNHVEAWAICHFNERVEMIGGRLTAPLILPSGVSRWPDLHALGGGRSYLLRAAAGPYSELGIQEIEADTLEFASIFSASIGGLDHRFSYDQFTGVLHALLVKQLSQRGFPVETLHDYVDKGTLKVEIGGKTFPLARNKELDLLIYGILPRLS